MRGTGTTLNDLGEMLARLSKKDLKNRRESVEGENIPKEDGKCVEKQASDTV